MPQSWRDCGEKGTPAGLLAVKCLIYLGTYSCLRTIWNLWGPSRDGKCCYFYGDATPRSRCGCFGGFCSASTENTSNGHRHKHKPPFRPQEEFSDPHADIKAVRRAGIYPQDQNILRNGEDALYEPPGISSFGK